MKQLRLFAAIATALLLCTAFTTKDKEKVVYAFGIAASFNDSIVYHTEIQALDSVQLNKNGFLPSREMYSYQLKNYIEYNLNKSNYTCMIYFSENKAKLEKEATKITGNYKRTKMTLQPIAGSEFRFKKP